MGAAATDPLWGASSSLASAHKYNLHYAPHLGMFKHHAGKDPIDQLNFMADQGFSSFEEKYIRKRALSKQEKISQNN